MKQPKAPFIKVELGLHWIGRYLITRWSRCEEAKWSKLVHMFILYLLPDAVRGNCMEKFKKKNHVIQRFGNIALGTC